jgi:hypothetical protein
MPEGGPSVRRCRSSPGCAVRRRAITPRDHGQVARFFAGLDKLPPGVAPINQWGLSGQINPTVGGLVGYCGMGRKPGQPARPPPKG